MRSKGKAMKNITAFLIYIQIVCLSTVLYGETADFPQLLEKARQGDAQAQYEVGRGYSLGDGVHKNEKEALRWYRLSAAQNNSYGQNGLGWYYLNGISVQQDGEEALKWFRLAAEQKNAKAQNNLGHYYCAASNYVEAIKWFKLAAEQQLPSAQYLLGLEYLEGTYAKQDDYKAAEWLLKAAESGHPEAQFDFGLMCFFGKGVSESEDEARVWNDKAAKQGFEAAIQERSHLYLNVSNSFHLRHICCVPNSDSALSFVDLFAAQGNAKAQFFLGKVWVFCGDSKEERDVGYQLYRQAAEQGFAEAQFRLGLFYYPTEEISSIDPKTTKKTVLLGLKEGDPKEAFRWFKLAADQDHAQALFYLGKCYRRGLGVEKSINKAAQFIFLAKEKGFEGRVLADDRLELEVLELSAEDGDFKAQCQLGLTYSSGKKDFSNGGTVILEADPKKAFFWYQLSANQGYADAQFLLGQCYDNGIGVWENDKEAIKWYRLAAEQGNADAQCNLGVLYANGAGVLEDYVEAYA